MNQQETTMQSDVSAKYPEWILEFDTDLEVAFDDELDFDFDSEI